MGRLFLAAALNAASDNNELNERRKHEVNKTREITVGWTH